MAVVEINYWLRGNKFVNGFGSRCWVLVVVVLVVVVGVSCVVLLWSAVGCRILCTSGCCWDLLRSVVNVCCVVLRSEAVCWVGCY